MIRMTKALRFAVLCLATFPAIAFGQPGRENVDSPGLVIEAVPGWDGYVDRSKPVPISFLLNNYSERIIEGELFLNDPVMGYETSLGEVLVSPGATRQFTTIRAITDWYECIATLRVGDAVLWQRNLPIMAGQGFQQTKNYALFVNAQVRKLRLQNTAIDTTATANIVVDNHKAFVAGEHGREVECLTVKPWQVPHHPGPLLAVQAIVFAEESQAAELNKAQWQAIAEWMCQGGIVFVHQASPDVIEKLIAASPLSEGPAITQDGYSVRRIGLGGIYEFTQPLFDQKSAGIREQIARTIGNRSGAHTATWVRSAFSRVHTTGQSEINQILVFIFFACYTALCGAALLLFRQSRRRIATYIVSVVVGASVLSGALGAMLRMSQGDLNWLTITQAGSGGVVQVGRLNVQSSGGRRTTVALSGTDVDLQVVESQTRYYYTFSDLIGFPPFNWTPVSVNDDRGTVNVPMTPWGSGQLHATAFGADIQPMKFHLKFHPKKARRNPSNALTINGAFTVNITNTLPVSIKESRLVIGVTGQLPAKVIEAHLNHRGISQTRLTSKDQADVQLVDLYQTENLPILGPGQVCKMDIVPNLQMKKNNQYDNGDRLEFDRSSLLSPRLSHLGTASAWIIVKFEESPILKIDDQKNDFTTHDGTHFFIQEIAPENMADPSVFYNEPRK